jgi:hypothetical protein
VDAGRLQVLIASIKTKMHAISPGVVEGLVQAVDLAEKDYQGLVIWSPTRCSLPVPTCRPCCPPS